MQKFLDLFDEYFELGQARGELIFVAVEKNVANFLSDEQVVTFQSTLHEQTYCELLSDIQITGLVFNQTGKTL